MRASKVNGMDVLNADHKNLGDIQDVVLDQESGRIAYAVLSFGGFLGIGDKLFAVPWGALKPTTDKKAFTLDIPKERLEKAPGFDKKNWPDLANRQWGADIHTYYNVPPYWEVRGGVVAPDVEKAPHGMLMRTSKVIGMDVHNPANQSLGDVKDLVLDQDPGVVAYAVLSFGGFLGLGDKLFALPWPALKLDADRKKFTLDVPKERLEKAPGFDQKDWPDLTNRQWGVDIHTYYGVTPYWEVRGARRRHGLGRRRRARGQGLLREGQVLHQEGPLDHRDQDGCGRARRRARSDRVPRTEPARVRAGRRGDCEGLRGDARRQEGLRRHRSDHEGQPDGEAAPRGPLPRLDS